MLQMRGHFGTGGALMFTKDTQTEVFVSKGPVPMISIPSNSQITSYRCVERERKVKGMSDFG